MLIDLSVYKVSIMPGQTIGYAWGTDAETGADVFFAGDWRPMLALGEAIGEEGRIDVSIESWQVIRIAEVATV